MLEEFMEKVSFESEVKLMVVVVHMGHWGVQRPKEMESKLTTFYWEPRPADLCLTCQQATNYLQSCYVKTLRAFCLTFHRLNQILHLAFTKHFTVTLPLPLQFSYYVHKLKSSSSTMTLGSVAIRVWHFPEYPAPCRSQLLSYISKKIDTQRL